MKGVSRSKFQKLVKAHRGEKRLTVGKNVAPLMYLQYLLFMKKVARDADLLAFSQRRQIIRVGDVKKAAEKVLRDFSLKDKVKANANQQMTSEGEDVTTSESEEDEETGPQPEELSESEEEEYKDLAF